MSQRRFNGFLSLNMEDVADYLIRPFQRFFKTSATGGILLIIAAAAAMIVANSGWAHGYHHLWETKLSISIGSFSLDKSLHHWINDGLMAIFFFLVGLELKREVLSGELSSLSNAVLPVMAAIGGMAVPAGLYAVFNIGGPAEQGWGIPMATDIAFALGILALLGSRIPVALVVFLTALAIADDLGAIAVIAIFYTEHFNVVALEWALVLLVVSFIINRMGVRRTIPYVVIGAFVWVLLLQSGIHATVAGVLLALTIPANRKISHSEFLEKIKKQTDEMTGRSDDANYCPTELEPARQQEIVVELEDAIHKAEAPLQHIEHHLHPWVVYLIVPIFAFANAGVELSAEAFGAALTSPVSLGIVAGLFFGKQIGIFTFSWLAVKLGFSTLPANIKFRHIYGVGILASIGFTMSLFINGLAFTDPAFIERAKIGILAASVISGVVGYVFLRFVTDDGAGADTARGR